MTQDEIIEMAKQSGMEVWKGGHRYMDDFDIYKFAKLVEEHVRKTMSDEAMAHLEELRKNFNTESAELRLHMWSKEKQA